MAREKTEKAAITFNLFNDTSSFGYKKRFLEQYIKNMQPGSHDMGQAFGIFL